MSVRAKVDIGADREICVTIQRGQVLADGGVYEWLTADEAIELANLLTDAVDQLDGRSQP